MASSDPSQLNLNMHVQYRHWVRALLIGMSVFAAVSGMVLAGGLDRCIWTQRVVFAGVPLHVPVVFALRWMTSPLGGYLLDGRHVVTRLGHIGFRRDDSHDRLEIECAPCRIGIGALSEEPLEFMSVRLTVARHGDYLAGEVAVGELRAAWHGWLTGQEITLSGELPETPVADMYALFRHRISEANVARIDGRIHIGVTWHLPAGDLHVDPQLEIKRVEGLGTGIWRSAVPATRCGDTPSGGANGKSRMAVSTASVPGRDGARLLRAAVIAAEDQNFYSHGGYDTAAIKAWLSVNAYRRTIVGGASTISQQLAKLLYVGGERTHIRKLRELLYATEMERTLGKERILDLYLTFAPWGPGICGADAAADHYFGKGVDELTVIETAWMAGLLRQPAQDKWDLAGQARRVQWVVGQMVTIPRKKRLAALRELDRVLYEGPESGGGRLPIQMANRAR